MGRISKPYRFSTGVIDPDRLNADFDTIYTLVNGGLDGSNIAEGGIEADNLNDSISPDVRWSETFRNYVVSDLVVTDSGLDCVVTAGIAYISGNRVTPSSSGHTVADDATTYCDLSSDGTFSWNSNASPLDGYLRLWKIVSATGACVLTDMRNFAPLSVWDLESEILTAANATTASPSYSTLLTVTMLDVEVGDSLIMAMSGTFAAVTNPCVGTFNFNVGGVAQTLVPDIALTTTEGHKTVTVLGLYAVTADASSLVVDIQWKSSAATLTAYQNMVGLYVLRLRPTR